MSKGGIGPTRGGGGGGTKVLPIKTGGNAPVGKTPPTGGAPKGGKKGK